jgi:hypothetical protein
MLQNDRPEAASQAHRCVELQRSPDRGILTGTAQGRQHPVCPTNSLKILREHDRPRQNTVLRHTTLAVPSCHH